MEPESNHQCCPSTESNHWPVLASAWSCLGLVRHLTLSDERYWFEVVVAGGELDFWPEGANGDWRVGDDESPASVIEAYRAAIDRADAILAERPLSAPPQRPEESWSEAGLSFPDLRAVIVHLSSRPRRTRDSSTPYES